MGDLVNTDDGNEEITKTGEESLHDEIIKALREVYDPELPVNLYDLGLI